jgi:hypothetical protein
MITIKHRQTDEVMVKGNTYQECFEKLKDENGVIQLSGSYLRGADLQGADLTGANLQGANLKGADLKGANLQGADLEGADLEGAYLTGAYLQGADLTGVNLTKAYLRGADLTGADLDYASWPLWCGSLSVKVDRKILAQLSYHLLRLMPEKERGKSLKKLANEFHGIKMHNLPKL